MMPWSRLFSFPPFFWPLCCLGDIMCVTVYSLVVFPIHGLWLSLLYLTILLKISYIGVWHHYPMYPLPDLYFCRLLYMNLWSTSNHFPWSRLDFVSCDLQLYYLSPPHVYSSVPYFTFVFSLTCLLWLIFESGCLTVPLRHSSFAFGTLLYLYLPIISNLYYLRFSQCYLLSTQY